MTSVQIALAAAGAAAVAGATIAAALTKSAIDSAESTGILAGKLGITALTQPSKEPIGSSTFQFASRIISAAASRTTCSKSACFEPKW